MSWAIARDRGRSRLRSIAACAVIWHAIVGDRRRRSRVIGRSLVFEPLGLAARGVRGAWRSATRPARATPRSITDVVAALPDPDCSAGWRRPRSLALNASAQHDCARAASAASSRLARAADSGGGGCDAACGARTASPSAPSSPSGSPPERWFEVFVTPLRGRSATAQVSAAGCCSTFRDLTPIRRVEEMRVDFVANASHELRTPLAALVGIHRDAERARAQRHRRARALPRHHGGAGQAHGAADRRSAVAVADRTRRACASGNAGRTAADRAAGDRCAADAGARPRCYGHRQRAEGAADRLRRSRRTDARVRKPGRECAEIRRLRQARGDHAVARLQRSAAARRRWSRCATTGRASPPSICRG